MFLNHDLPFPPESIAHTILGMNPPAGVYFVMEFEHNLDHPINEELDPSERCFESAAQRTMAEARAIAHGVAADWAEQHDLTLIAEEGGIDEEGILLPRFLGVDQGIDLDEADEDDFESDEHIAFSATVRMIDYRNETIH